MYIYILYEYYVCGSHGHDGHKHVSYIFPDSNKYSDHMSSFVLTGLHGVVVIRLCVGPHAPMHNGELHSTSQGLQGYSMHTCIYSGIWCRK